MTLSPTEARSYYDRFGKKQDRQGFYEDRPLEDLVAHAELDEAQRVFELGCGTGRLADLLLREHLPASASYVGSDLSQTMISLATERLSRYGERVRLHQSDGTIRLPLADDSADRVVSTYVLDLLSETDIESFFAEARRVLVTGGLLCLVGLTPGATPLSRVVSTAWSWVFRLRAKLVGGCRPMRLVPFVERGPWTVHYRNVVVASGVPSEVLIARAESVAEGAS